MEQAVELNQINSWGNRKKRDHAGQSKGTQPSEPLCGVGAASKSAWAGVGKRCGWKCHPGSAFTGLGEFPPALDVAIAEINKKTDLNAVIDSLDRSKHRRRPKRYRTAIEKEKYQLKPSTMVSTKCSGHREHSCRLRNASPQPDF
jgi:hypothetical protein